ncbi:MAG: hypothetical protein COB02_09130 [Candidatus Cloacimonadota bacterium]|nr:MAG: hypothetical protein COB02_09130 [Candidatus Cloacimonadota bacterium]
MNKFKIKQFFKTFLIVSFIFLTACEDKKLSPKQQLFPVASNFIELIQKGEFTQSYYLSHPQFQKKSSLSDFHYLCKFYKLDIVSNFQFNDFSIKKSTGKVNGLLTYNNDIDIPIVLRFGKDGKQFKVIHIDLDLKTFFENNGMLAPNKQQLKYLIEKTFKKFHSASRKGSMKDFYKTISSVWKNQLELYEFNDIYSDLMISSFTKHSFKEFKTRMDKASGINKSGILMCTGSIHAEISISYNFQYYYEDGIFKPLSVRVKLIK